MAEENLTVIREKFSNTISNKMKAQVWQAISNKVNSLGVAQRTINEVKDKWRSMVGVARKEFNLEKSLRKKTGGGKQPAPLSANAERIIHLFEDEPGFSGIPGGVESGQCSLRYVALYLLSQISSLPWHRLVVREIAFKFLHVDFV